MNFFGTEAFLESAAEALFPRQTSAPAEVTLDGRTWRVLRVGRRLVTELPYLDFHEPVDATGGGTTPVAWLSKAERGRVPLDAWGAEDGELASPFVDWSRFGAWKDFEAHVKRSSKSFFGDVRRRIRRMEERLGPVESRFHDPDPALVDACLLWKSHQYRRTGLPDLLRSGKVVRLFRQLQRRGQLTVSSVRARGRPVAIHLGMVHRGRFHYWVPAYDPGLPAFSPGKVLLARMLEASWREGHSEFDFLLGDEPYKLTFATHVRRVGPLGEPPLARRLWHPARAALVRALRRAPSAYRLAQRAKRRAVELGLG